MVISLLFAFMVVSPPPLVSSYGGHHPSLGSRCYSCQADLLRVPLGGWLAIRSSAAAERRMVEVGGVEPPSETASPEHLRV